MVVVSRRVQCDRITLWRVLVFGTARGRDWFQSSACVLFGDAVLTVFPLGRLVLPWTAGHWLAGKFSEIPMLFVMKSLPVLDSKAAAIDVGSESLHVSVAGDTPKVFSTFTVRTGSLA